MDNFDEKCRTVTRAAVDAMNEVFGSESAEMVIVIARPDGEFVDYRVKGTIGEDPTEILLNVVVEAWAETRKDKTRRVKLN